MTTTSPTRIGAALTALAAAALLAAAPAQADATSAICTERFPAVTLTPGFGLAETSGTGTTGGQTGSIDCTGRLDSQRVTGRGTIGFDEQYTGTCASDHSVGILRATIPTTAGVQHLTGTFTERRSLLAITVEVRFPGSRYTGIGAIVPTLGSCILSPIRRASLLLTGTIRDE